jgi:7-cyano-7-deazaguanine synthase
MDSTALLYWMKNDGLTPLALHISYGQPAEAAEWSAVSAICHDAQVDEPLRLQVPLVRRWGLELERQCRTRSDDDDYVPSRNLMLITFASMCAYGLDLHRIMIGFISAQSSHYPDATAGFLAAANRLIRVEHPSMQIEAPLLALSKAEALRAAISFGMNPALTFSCNRESRYHCQSCGSCGDRFAAMDTVGLL